MKTMLTAGKFKKSSYQNELVEVAQNLSITNAYLRKYVEVIMLEETGLFPTFSEIEERAQDFSQKLIDANLMINGLLLPGVLDGLQEEIKRLYNKHI